MKTCLKSQDFIDHFEMNFNELLILLIISILEFYKFLLIKSLILRMYIMFKNEINALKKVYDKSK